MVGAEDRLKGHESRRRTMAHVADHLSVSDLEQQYRSVIIPTRADDHALAQSRRPMDMMSQGWSMRRFQASQQWSTMSRQEANTRLDNQLSRRNCQMFSTGFNSGARAGSSTSVRLSGTTRSLARCHPARSISMTPWAPGARLVRLPLSSSSVVGQRMAVSLGVERSN